MTYCDCHRDINSKGDAHDFSEDFKPLKTPPSPLWILTQWGWFRVKCKLSCYLIFGTHNFIFLPGPKFEAGADPDVSNKIGKGRGRIDSNQTILGFAAVAKNYGKQCSLYHSVVLLFSLSFHCWIFKKNNYKNTLLEIRPLNKILNTLHSIINYKHSSVQQLPKTYSLNITEALPLLKAAHSSSSSTQQPIFQSLFWLFWKHLYHLIAMGGPTKI